MTRSVLGRISARCVGTILSLLIVGAVIPSATEAGCLAHYVRSRSSAIADLTKPELVDPAGMITPPGQAAPASDADSRLPSRSPCTGALCSGNHAPPVSTTPGVPAPTFGQWGILPVGSPKVVTASLWCPPVNELPRPFEGGRGVFHPPR